MSEEQFWKATPKKLVILLRQHATYQQLLWSPLTGQKPESAGLANDEYNAIVNEQLMYL